MTRFKSIVFCVEHYNNIDTNTSHNIALFYDKKDAIKYIHQEAEKLIGLPEFHNEKRINIIVKDNICTVTSKDETRKETWVVTSKKIRIDNE